MAFPSNATLQDAMELGRTQMQTLIRMGAEWGLWDMVDSPTGHRRAVIQDGRLAKAWGFDLTPLAASRAEFEQVAKAHQERRREGGRMRHRITTLRKQVQALAQAGGERGVAGLDWSALDRQALAVAAERSASEDPAQLAPLVERLTGLHAQAEAALFSGPGCPVDRGETEPSGPVDRTPNTPTNQPIAEDDTIENAGPVRPKADKRASQRTRSPASGHHPGKLPPQPVGIPARHPALPSALRGFVVTPAFLIQVAPAFRGWISHAQPGWEDMMEAATYVCAELDIAPHTWGQACILLGRMEAVTLVAVAAAKHATGAVEKPNAWLRAMVRRHMNGELHLDRTLFGLADRLRLDTLAREST